ncbi:SagB/ThcOx family dehydrogenase [Candidatus Riflebacteria bacterium]
MGDNREKITQFLKTFIRLIIFGFCVVLLLIYGFGRSSDIGLRFHNETNLTPGTLAIFRTKKPEKFPPKKSYPQLRAVKLPPPAFKGITVEEAILQRRSKRDFSKKPLNLTQLSQLLFAAQGITKITSKRHFHSAPSAGAIYPFEIYISVNNIKGLAPAIYHYEPIPHQLKLLKPGDFSQDIFIASIRQGMFKSANVTFFLAAIFDRIRFGYGERGLRYLYMEAGHISQNIFLQAESLGLGSVCVGAFFDAYINQIIGLDGEKEAVIYLHAVGTL